MQVISTPQKIDIVHRGKAHWFEVWRFTTRQDFIEKLQSDRIKIDLSDNSIAAYTQCYATSDECGRMYILDSTISTMAHEAVHMASGILARSGAKTMDLTIETLATADDPDAYEVEEDFSYLVGLITSELYKHNKYF